MPKHDVIDEGIKETAYKTSLVDTLRARDDPPGMYNTGDPTEDPQADVDPEVCPDAALEEHSERRDEQSEKVEKHVVSRRDRPPRSDGDGRSAGGGGCAVCGGLRSGHCVGSGEGREEFVRGVEGVEVLV